MKNAGTDGLQEARRILVIGPGGSGKSTLARRLGNILDLDVIHLDRFYWRPGWEEKPRKEWTGVVRRLIEQEAWILDGNYGGTLDIRLEAADAVIFLDFPRTLCIRRVMARRLCHARRSRPDMAPGCPDRLTFKFLKYLWRYPVEQRPGILEKLERRSDDKIVQILRSPEQVHEFVAGLEGRKNISGKR